MASSVTTNPHLDVPLHPGLAESESSIELEHLTLPIGATTSTDNLARVSFESESTPREIQTQEPVISEPRVEGPSIQNRPRPNYKTLSLQWPFLVFILTLVGGIFAFLEYQAHDLPPLHYSMVQIDDPEPDPVQAAATIPRKTVSIGPSVTSQPTPLPKSWLNIASRTTYSPSTRSVDITGLVKRTAEPSPGPIEDRRPSSGAYPSPISSIRTYCGWKPPVWLIKVDGPGIVPIYDRPCPECESECFSAVPTLRDCLCYTLWLDESIPTFLTEDQSWCPCEISRGPGGEVDYTHSKWGRVAMLGNPDQADSNDQGCKTLMSAILSFNHYRTQPLEFTVLRNRSNIRLGGTNLVQGYYTTPPTRTEEPWAYFKTKDNGDIMVPLVTRTAGPEQADVFGNKVQPSDSGLFPDGFRSRYLPNIKRNPCYSKDRYPTRYNWPLDCTETRASYSTVWWHLPFSRPNASSTWLSVESSTFPAIPTFTLTESASSLLQSTVDSSTLTDQKTSILSPAISTRGSDDITTSQPDSTKKIPSSEHAVILTSDQHSSVTPIASIFTDSHRDTPTRNIPGERSQDPARNPSTAPRSPFPPVNHTPLGVTPIAGISMSSHTDRLTRVTEPHELVSVNVKESAEASGTSTTQIPITDLHSAAQTTLVKATAATTQAKVTPADSADLPRIFGGPEKPGPILPKAQSFFHNLRSEADYLMASVFPVLLATLFSIPMEIFIASLHRIIPFRALDRENGALAEDTICLSLNGGSSPLALLTVSVRFLRRFRDPMPLLTFLLGTLSIILIPISSEVIRLEFSTACDDGSEPGFSPTHQRLCAFGVRKSGPMIRFMEALLVIMITITLILGFLLARWRTGVGTEPWSIATMASLMASTRRNELSNLLRTVATDVGRDNKLLRDIDKQIQKALEGKRFRLGHITGPDPPDPTPWTHASYGLQVTTPPMRDDKPIRLTTRGPPTRKAVSMKRWKFTHLPPMPMNTELYIRVLALLFILGLLSLVLHYETTISPGTAFEAFMNSQSFGVRILFTAFGTAISSYWGYYFSYVSESQIHYRLLTANQTRGLPANASILLSPPSNVFFGLWRSISALRTIRSGARTVSRNTGIETNNNTRSNLNTNLNIYQSTGQTISLVTSRNKPMKGSQISAALHVTNAGSSSTSSNTPLRIKGPSSGPPTGQANNRAGESQLSSATNSRHNPQTRPENSVPAKSLNTAPASSTTSSPCTLNPSPSSSSRDTSSNPTAGLPISPPSALTTSTTRSPERTLNPPSDATAPLAGNNLPNTPSNASSSLPPKTPLRVKSLSSRPATNQDMSSATNSRHNPQIRLAVPPKALQITPASSSTNSPCTLSLVLENAPSNTSNLAASQPANPESEPTTPSINSPRNLPDTPTADPGGSDLANNPSSTSNPPTNLDLESVTTPPATPTKHDLLYLHICLATLLAKFTPILLSNIPFSNTVTWKIHEWCTWMAVGFLSYMVIVLLVSLLLQYELEIGQIWRHCRGWLVHIYYVGFNFVRRRTGMKATQNRGNNTRSTSGTAVMGTERLRRTRTTGAMMPVKVDTMAGYMYYLCDSKMTADFEGDTSNDNNGLGLLEMGHHRRDRLVCDMGRRYVMAEIVGAEGGNKRVGVDYCEGQRQYQS